MFLIKEEEIQYFLQSDSNKIYEKFIHVCTELTNGLSSYHFMAL